MQFLFCILLQKSTFHIKWSSSGLNNSKNAKISADPKQLNYLYHRSTQWTIWWKKTPTVNLSPTFLSINFYEITKPAKSSESSQTGENQAKLTKKMIVLWKKKQKYQKIYDISILRNKIRYLKAFEGLQYIMYVAKCYSVSIVK